MTDKKQLTQDEIREVRRKAKHISARMRADFNASLKQLRDLGIEPMRKDREALVPDYFTLLDWEIDYWFPSPSR